MRLVGHCEVMIQKPHWYACDDSVERVESVKTMAQVKKRLAEGDPAIEVTPSTNRERLVIGTWMMQPGDAEVVAQKVAEILKGAAA